MTVELPGPERLAIEWQCERLVRRFALLSDAGDADGLAALFTEDGVFARPTRPDQPVRGREAIRAAFAARPRDRLTRHFCANTVIDVLGPDRARGHSYVALYTGSAGTGAQGAAAPAADPVQLVGEYRDTFALVDGQWHIAERIGSVTFSFKGASS
ncbi:nuclear transport factor 2 family protein [Arenibaculum pallidiluteum]|uniref:nuclear transport factor 2 family protein n=1 Tax=Arenibaculum pallidiluteum TaxID=2812559 RepID=UPI001A957A56|nr:nuclear transport factor 2 family protein [Arenibaculum pallidiluteum]